jgi:hypothetical protein
MVVRLSLVPPVAVAHTALEFSEFGDLDCLWAQFT